MKIKNSNISLYYNENDETLTITIKGVKTKDPIMDGLKALVCGITGVPANIKQVKGLKTTPVIEEDINDENEEKNNHTSETESSLNDTQQSNEKNNVNDDADFDINLNVSTDDNIEDEAEIKLNPADEDKDKYYFTYIRSDGSFINGISNSAAMRDFVQYGKTLDAKIKRDSTGFYVSSKEEAIRLYEDGTYIYVG